MEYKTAGDSQRDRAALFALVFTTHEGKRVLEMLMQDANVGRRMGRADLYALGRHDAIVDIADAVREGIEARNVNG